MADEKRRIVIVQLTNGHTINALEPINVLTSKIEDARTSASKGVLAPLVPCTYLLRYPAVDDDDDEIYSTEPGAFAGEFVAQLYSTEIDQWPT